MADTAEEIFAQAQILNNDITSIDAFKTQLASNNTSSGLVKSFFGAAASKLSPDTEDALNTAFLSALNTVLDSSKTNLSTQFDNLLTPA